MIQFGQNAGPRHLSVFGHVKNLKSTKITSSEKVQKDCQLLGIFGLSWNTMKGIVPASVIDVCEDAMQREDLPRMETAEDQSRKMSFIYIILIFLHLS